LPCLVSESNKWSRVFWFFFQSRSAARAPPLTRPPRLQKTKKNTKWKTGDTYLCLTRCYEIDAEDFFEVRWRRRASVRAAARLAARKKAAAATGGSVGGGRGRASSLSARLDSAGGASSATLPAAVDEDAEDVDCIERVRDAVSLVDADTGAPLDIAQAEADYCRRRALSRRRASANAPGADDDALEAGAGGADGNDKVAAAVAASNRRPRAVALLHDYPALSRWAFGRRLGTAILSPFQVMLIVGICIAYQITGSEALHSIAMSARALAQTAAAPAGGGLSSDAAAASASAAANSAAVPKAPFYVAFAVLQGAFAVGLGSIAESSLVSFGGVVASVVYCGVASGLSLAAVAWRAQSGGPAPDHGPANALYAPGGAATGPNAPGGPVLGAAFAALNAVSMFLFTMGGHNIALETQAVLPSPPPSTLPAMRRGVDVAFAITAVACFWVGVTGYAAFGSSVGDNILTTLSKAAVGGAQSSGVSASGAAASALGALSPASLVAVRVAVIVAQFAIFAHVLAAYNVYAQTLWAGAERRLAGAWQDWRDKKAGGGGKGQGAAAAAAASPSPSSPAVVADAKAARREALGAMLARAPLRLVYVVAVLAVAFAVPFFGAVAGIVGAACITPTTFVLPYALEVVRHRAYDRTDDGRASRPRSTLPAWRLAACWVGGLGASLVGLAGTAASVYLIVAQLGAKNNKH